jgi:hypothetical protein
MKCICALLLSVVLPISMFAAESQNAYKVAYDGGTLSDVKTGSDL